ncbi:MAG: hypothetical protein R3248_15080 [Candidatus Promineifilaceae bacterium]|nr:hypothetical protein [Candidatus Promineifilaceae bacterium]
MTGDSFDWQTEEPADERQKKDAPRPARLARRRLPLLLIGLLTGVLALAAGFLLWRRAERRMQTTQERLEADVRSAYRLALEALQNRDRERLRSLLPPGDEAWEAAQLALLEQGQLLGGAPRALGLLSLSEEPQEEVDVRLAPNLREAQVQARWAYAVSATETVTFTQTAFFRLEDDRWWLSPPAADDWYERHAVSGERITLDAPTRDAALAERLAGDLDALLADMCRTVVHCPDRFRARVHLQSEALSLASLDPLASTLTIGAGDPTLPTPSLVGLPAGEAAYDALFRGYARYVIAAVVADLMEYDCCDQALFFRALLERQLAHLGLQPMPSAPVGYQLLDEGASLDVVQEYWWVDRPDVPSPPTVHAFLAFLSGTWVGGPAAEPVEAALMRALNEPVNVNFWAWIADLPRAGEGPVDESITKSWRRYVLDRLQAQGSLQEEPPLSHDLLAACEPAGGGALNVRRYDVTEEEWLLDTQLPANAGAPLNHAHLISLPGGNYIFRPFFPQDSFNSWLVRGDQPRFSNERLLALSEAGNPLVEVIPFNRGPDGRLAAFLDNKAGDAETLQYALFDPERCGGVNPGCPLWRIPGRPIWSPDGDQLLALRTWGGTPPDNYVRRLHLRRELENGDEAGWELLSEAPIAHPFWLNGGTVGYLRDRGPYGYQEVVLNALATGDERLLLDVGDLLLELDRDFADLELVWAARHPLTPDSLLVLATAFEEQNAIFFAVERPAGNSWMKGAPRIRILGDIGAAPQAASMTEPHVSPDGRWLSFVAPWIDTARRETGARFWIFDLRHEETILNVSAYIPRERYFASSLGLYNWSPDGTWLARLIEGGVDLFAPASGTRRVVPHDFARCSSVAWIGDG